jgi:D-alanyl-D-alanine endopeptidase (penicillin-binding protein 7)
MNDKAKEISMSQTNFDDPSGLSYLNQSTAHDLFLLLSYVKKQYPYILDVTRQSTVTIRNKTTDIRKTLTNINEFAGRSDFLGGKTGFIDLSGGNLISLFYKNGKMVYIGVLGSPDRFGETEKILSCIQ